MLSVGDRLRNYEILAQLKPGGMGTLYLGRRVGAAGFTQHVAIKVIHPHLSSDEMFVSLFVNEALLGSRIEHSNVVRVEELGEEKGLYFLVMEYVHGCSIAEILKKLRVVKRTMTIEVAVAIAARVAEGLQAVHETKDAGGKPLELVHRDVSPQNILLSTTGNVKLIDFGIAKAMAEGVATSGSLKGKIRYMSPEQAYGRPIDRRSDLYSLAIVLWEMLTRRRMFRRGDDLAVLDRVRAAVIEPPSRHRSDVPTPLENVVMQALRRDPNDRYPTAREFRMRLFSAVPRAHDIDSSRLADLVAELMQDEIAAAEQLVPSDAVPPVPKRHDSAGMTVTADISAERALAEQVAASVELTPAPKPWPWVGASAALAILGLFVAWMLLASQREEPVPIQSMPAQLPAVKTPPPPPPEPPSPPPVETIEEEPPKVERTRAVKKKQRKRRPPSKEGPKSVDGVPLLEDPGF